VNALAVLALLCAAAPAAGAPRVAVWGIEAGPDVSPGAAQILGDIVATELSRTGRFQVIGRSDLGALLGYEKQKAVLGCTESGCLAEIGGAIGADLVLSGQAGRLGTQYRLSLLAVDARKAVARARAARFTEASEDALARIVPELVAEIVGALGTGPMKDLAATAPGLLEEASALAAQGKHAEAAARYDLYPSRFPQGAERCLSTFKAGAEWESAGKRQAAADRFAAVGSDEACAARGPNAAGSALARAGGLYEALGLSREARLAFEKLVALPGVSDASVRAKVEAARMRLGLDSSPR
jgi:TolB-like protein